MCVRASVCVCECLSVFPGVCACVDLCAWLHVCMRMCVVYVFDSVLSLAIRVHRVCMDVFMCPPRVSSRICLCFLLLVCLFVCAVGVCVYV